MKLGNNDVSDLRLGTNQVKEVRLGNDLVWSNAFSWSPSNFGSGLLAWWRADSGITLSGSNVTTWDDISGNNLTATAVGSFGVSNASAINNNQVVNVAGNYFTLTDELATSLGGKSGCTVIIIARRLQFEQTQPLFDIGINNSNSKLYAEFRTNDTFLTQARSVAGDSSFATSLISVINTNYFYGSLKYNISGDSIVHGLGGAFESPVSQSYTGSTFNNNAGDFHALFAYFDGSLSGNFDVAEIFFVDKSITDQESDNISWYINNRYGLSVSYIIGDPSL